MFKMVTGDFFINLVDTEFYFTPSRPQQSDHEQAKQMWWIHHLQGHLFSHQLASLTLHQHSPGDPPALSKWKEIYH